MDLTTLFVAFMGSDIEDITGFQGKRKGKAC